MTIGVGKERTEFGEIRFSIKEAHRAVGNRIKNGVGRLIYAEGIPYDARAKEGFLEEAWKEQLKSAVESYSPDRIEQLINPVSYTHLDVYKRQYPYMIEIFSRNPDFIILEDDAVLTPLPIDDEISSLSAILLNEAYYELLKTGQMMVDGIPVLSPTCLIPFKAKAWLDLKERKLNGEQVDSKNIKKHKNDVFRLAQLITCLLYTSRCV